MRALFDEFEEIVNGQMFKHIDEIEGKDLQPFQVRAVFENGQEVDNQVIFKCFLATGDVSFKLARVPSAR